MYAHTRIRSIRRQLANDTIADRSADVVPTLNEKEERDLAMHILQYSDVILRVERELLPNYLCDYLYRLAGRFHVFYERCKVLKNPAVESRLQLCFATEAVLKQGLTLLGVQTVERM